MRRREEEWRAIARAQQQEETKKYKAELRARLGESECRCTRYKLEHWEGLWRQDRAKATRLRQQGWHVVGVCELLDEQRGFKVSQPTVWWLEVVERRLQERGTARHAVQMFCEEDEEALAKNLDRVFMSACGGRTGINAAWKKVGRACARSI